MLLPFPVAPARPSRRRRPRAPIAAHRQLDRLANRPLAIRLVTKLFNILDDDDFVVASARAARFAKG